MVGRYGWRLTNRNGWLLQYGNDLTVAGEQSAPAAAPARGAMKEQAADHSKDRQRPTPGTDQEDERERPHPDADRAEQVDRSPSEPTCPTMRPRSEYRNRDKMHGRADQLGIEHERTRRGVIGRILGLGKHETPEPQRPRSGRSRTVRRW